MDKFDVIIVGAGPAGATAGYMLAKEGLNVLIVERGQAPGSKNVSGGLIYSQTVAEIYPEFWSSAPVERAITSHRLVMLGDRSSVDLDYTSEEAAKPPYNAFSVLRAKFDPWMAQQAEAAGASLITGIAVDALLANNEIDEAENYMEARRRVFWENGYKIRKLNQAYFAFYGAYADEPFSAAGADPVGNDVRLLRARSRNLLSFIQKISWMSSYEQLEQAVDSD